MEKTDSLAPKTEYPASEVSFSSEPPPAYRTPRSTALQIARIAALTIVISSFVLGSFILASSWIQASKSCKDHHHSPQQKVSDDSPMFQKLVDVSSLAKDITNEPITTSTPPPSTSQSSEEEKKTEESISPSTKLPLTLDFDEIAGALLNQNLKSKMNCVVEKKRTEAPENNKTVISITGEQMVIFCHSDKDERGSPEENLIPPMMLPIPGPIHFPFHLPFQSHVFTPHHVPVHQQEHVPDHVSFHPIPVHHEPHPEKMNLNHIPLHPVQHEVPHRPQHYFQAPPQSEQRSRQIEAIREALPFIHQQVMKVLSETREPPFMSLLKRFAGMRAVPIQVIEQKTSEHSALPSDKMPMQVAEVEVAREGRSFRHPVQIPTIQVVDPHEARLIQMAEAREARVVPAVEIPAGKMFPPGMPIAEITQEAVIPVAEAREFPAIPDTRVRPPALPENDRPHYVQPRSIRSIENVLRREKRTRRCACDCAC